jgi:hypothetical protein
MELTAAMKAIAQEKHGSADVLELRDVEKPQPEDDVRCSSACMLRASTQESGI